MEEKILVKIGHYHAYKGMAVHGRALLAKACLLSHIWYASSVAPYDGPLLERLFKTICKFVHTPTPGFKRITNAHSRAPRDAGGLGLIDPSLELRAIHAHLIAKLLSAVDDPSPWRSLLWHSLLSLPLPRGTPRPPNFLAFDWRTVKFEEETLASSMLVAWAMLQPLNVPRHDPLSWETFNRRLLAYPPLLRSPPLARSSCAETFPSPTSRSRPPTSSS